MTQTPTNSPSKLRKLWQLFSTFFRIGAFTFGGGQAMIPLIQREAVEKYGWISDDDMLEIVAIAEITPGPIAINSATFVGFRVAGTLGSAFATLGVTLPSVIIISIVSLILEKVQDIRAVKYAFFGIRAGVVALLINTVVKLLKKCKKSVLAYALAAGAFLASAFTAVNVLWLIAAAALIGLLSSLILSRNAGRKKGETK